MNSTKRVSRMAALAAAAGLCFAAVGAAAQEGGRPISVTLTGAAERPGPGDPDGTGSFTARINPGQGQICYELSVANIATPTAAHIHKAPPTDPGPVVVPLATPTSGSSSGCASISRALAKDLIQNPQNYYVNVHNADFGPGAVRAQLSK